MCVPRCSNVGLISILLSAHTNPLVDFSLGGNGARDLLLIRRGVAQKLDGQSLVLKRFDARLFYLLTYALHMPQVILEQDVIRTEVLLHPLHHHRLQAPQYPKLKRRSEPRNTRRSKPLSVPRICSRYLLINFSMNVLQIVLFRFGDLELQRHDSTTGERRCYSVCGEAALCTGSTASSPHAQDSRAVGPNSASWTLHAFRRAIVVFRHGRENRLRVTLAVMTLKLCPYAAHRLCLQGCSL